MEYHVHIPRDGATDTLDNEQRWRIRNSIEQALAEVSVEPIILWRPNPPKRKRQRNK